VSRQQSQKGKKKEEEKDKGEPSPFSHSCSIILNSKKDGKKLIQTNMEAQ
jgi:hypothetical protein